ncbi:MAG: AAA family ATPase [Chlorobium sp.]|nr:AAA family ATPase [Chlorobium sp.]
MTAKLIAVINQKGGVGKTTLTMLLAGTWGRAGKKVLVVDADPQGTASQWSAASDDRPFPASVVNLAHAGNKLHREIQKHVDNYDMILIDCPPSVELQSQSALLISDIALVPIPPSPPALWGSRGIKLLIEKAEVVNEALRGFVVLNMVKRTALSRDIQKLLDQFGLPTLKSTLKGLTAYEEAAALGCTLQDLGSSAKTATIELEAVAAEVLSLLGVK